MQYTYTALTENGTETKGTLEANSPDEAREILAARGYIPTVVKSGSGSGTGFWEDLRVRLSKVKPQQLILFTKQFRTMFRAGIPVMDIFRTMEHQTENRKLRSVIVEMAGMVQEGSSLYDAFNAHPEVFSPLYCSMVQAGETSGSLPEVMERLVYLLEHEQKVRNDIRSALQYPIIVVIALGIAFFVLLTFVIPKFVTIFKSAGIDLPLPTVIAIGLYNFLAGYWYWIILALIGLIMASVWFFRRPYGRLLLHTFLLRIPILGPVFMKSAMSRFASIMAILQSSGVSVLDSLDILSRTIGNSAISLQFDRVKEQLKEGRGISGPLKSAKYFTPMVVDMVAIGEEAGNLDEMLREVASHYDEEVEYAVGQMTTNLGPILVVGLAAVVGFFALAIFLPMWDLTQMVQ
ncbi:MAG: type II secretion system F family protein [Desulfonatronovibrionaceae bacterium]